MSGGHKTHFKKVDYTLSGLLHDIDSGDIALPDIQRPFVWSNAKVRDLFDSMYRGFPVGYLLFWQNAGLNGTKQIGTEAKQHEVPYRLIVDGQQRLTSLYSVFRGVTVIDADFRPRRIEIAFCPRDGRFEVADAATRKDPEWIPSISTLWAGGKSSYSIVAEFLGRLESAKGALDLATKETISHNLDRLFDLQNYPFTVLEIAPDVAEEQVADIFVRINSTGVQLNQSDFILTLMSVFWEDGRRQLEEMCRLARVVPGPGSKASPFNYLFQPEPDQLLRASVAFGFRRARLVAVYNVLRGKDVDTGVIDPAKREEQFARLKIAQESTLDLTHWEGFLKSVWDAGYRSAAVISSQTALVYSYAFYLLGRKTFAVPEHELRRLIGRWFFASSLTSRYTSSPESRMEQDLNLLRDQTSAHAFADALNAAMSADLTNDYWATSLPAAMETSSARNPQRFSYLAAQILLKAPVLFSDSPVSSLLDPALKLQKSALEWHHLFPRAWLESQGVTERTRINQQANLALVEWPDNLRIGDQPPAEYVAKIRPRFSDESWTTMHRLNALPLGWENLSYEAFLQSRRELMASVIRHGYESLNACVPTTVIWAGSR